MYQMKSLDVVATTRALPDASVAKGQVGTVVELLDVHTVLVEFADHHGVAYAMAPIPVALLELRQTSN